MHAKSGLRVVLKWKIFRPDSVIADVITLSNQQSCDMFDFDGQPNADALMNELRRFVQFWVDPVLPVDSLATTFDSELPRPLNALLSIHAAYDQQIFSSQNTLLAFDQITIADDRAYFIDINQSGSVVCTLINNDDDPPVYLIDNNEHFKCTDSLSEYLVSFALAELMYWAATQENECGECWDLDFPAIGRQHGHSVNAIWTRRPYIWPKNIATFHLVDGNVLTVEQANGTSMSSSVGLKAALRASVLKEFPTWD